MANSITVATCCYDKDWEVVLSPGYLSKQFAKFKYDFAEKMVVINTDKNRDDITSAAEKLCRLGEIDCFYFTSDYKNAFNKEFHIKNFRHTQVFNPFLKTQGNLLLTPFKNFYYFYIKKKGTYRRLSVFKKEFDCSAYALGPLCAIYKATSDYLIYFTEDCAVEDTGEEWIDSGIELINQHDQYIAVRPTDDDLDKMYTDLFEWQDGFWIGYMFTDRMFLANVKTLSEIDYNVEPTNNYPPYGGAGFEAKMFYYMKKHKKRILICPQHKYIHEHKEYMDKVF